MTIFTVERCEDITTDTEVDFGQGGLQTIRVSCEDVDIDVDIYDHDIAYLDEDEATDLVTSIREHHPEALKAVVVKADVVKWIAENISELGDVMNCAISHYNTDYIAALNVKAGY